MSELIDMLCNEVATKDILHSSKVKIFLADLRAKGKLGTSDITGRQVHRLQMWDGYAKGSTESWHERDAADMIAMWLFLLSNSLRKDADPMQDVRTFLETGTISEDHFYMRSSDDTDQVTGDRGLVVLKDWKPVYYVRDENYKYKLAESVDPIVPVTVEFTAPSGRLFFTDALRVGDFMNLTDPPSDKQYKEYSLNTLVGRQNLTRYYADEHNIGYCQTTNTCVGVYRRENELIIADRWTDGEDTEITGWDHVGNFSCDMWRIMVADAQEVGRILKDDQALDTYLKSNEPYSDNVFEIQLAEGSKITMTSGERFNETLDRLGLGVEEGVYVWAHYVIT